MTTNSETFIIRSVPVRLICFVVSTIALYRVLIQLFSERYSTKSEAETFVLINLRKENTPFFHYLLEFVHILLLLETFQ